MINDKMKESIVQFIITVCFFYVEAYETFLGSFENLAMLTVADV